MNEFERLKKRINRQTESLRRSMIRLMQLSARAEGRNISTAEAEKMIDLWAAGHPAFNQNLN